MKRIKHALTQANDNYVYKRLCSNLTNN